MIEHWVKKTTKSIGSAWSLTIDDKNVLLAHLLVKDDRVVAIFITNIASKKKGLYHVVSSTAKLGRLKIKSRHKEKTCLTIPEALKQAVSFANKKRNKSKPFKELARGYSDIAIQQAHENLLEVLPCQIPFMDSKVKEINTSMWSLVSQLELD
jgi:hypothetical protein